MEEKKYTAEEALNLQSSAYQKGYNEGYQLRKQGQPQPGAVWVKATRENMRRSAILRDSVLPENHIHQWVVSGWDEKGVKFTNRVEKEWWELEILDESGTAAAVTPTFWDVAKAFKWAAEYRDEIGGQLTLYNDQWTLISEDEDGNENDTKDLTPGNVAELYCLQNGFNKENEGTTAGKEEDGEKAQFNNWHRWLSENGYTYDGEYYYDQDNNYFTPDQLWAKFK